MGDGTNLVLILAGELLKKAENILVMGLHPSEVTQGYEMALNKALSELESLSVTNMRLQSNSFFVQHFLQRPFQNHSPNPRWPRP